MDERSPRQRINSESILDKKITRRRLLGAGAVVALTALGINRLQDSEESQTDREPTFSLGYAEQLRSIAETEGLEGLVKFFRITKDEYPTESDFGTALAERAEAWIFADCIPGESTSSTPGVQSGGNHEDTYGLAAITGLAGEVAVEQANGDLAAIPLYQKMTTARSEMRELYLTEMGGSDTTPTTTVDVLRNDMTAQDPYRHEFHRAVDLQYKIQGEGALLTIDGSLNLVLDTSSDAYELSLNETEPTPPFAFSHG